MKITKLRLSNFQSFGEAPTEIDLSDVTYVLGPNGAGKTTVLTALARLFSPLPAQRKIQLSDFHIPNNGSGVDLHQQRPELWIEVDVEIPEAGEEGQHASVPLNFAHMRIDSQEGVPHVRIRLTGIVAADGVIDEKIQYVLEYDDSGNPTSTEDMNRYDRGSIEVHYLPARRDPADHISYTTSSLLGRLLRAANWSAEKSALQDLSQRITSALSANDAVSSIGDQLSAEWDGLHTGSFFKKPSIAFGNGDLESVLRQLTISFSPSHNGAGLPFERLSDGQKSLLYIALVLAWHSLSRKVLKNEEPSLDGHRLHPPAHTVIALEEPENSLAPQYLGRIIRQLKTASDEGDVQSLIATHSPALLRRVDPESICFLRLDSARQTQVRRIVLPDDKTEAGKYVREAILGFPELYFSRLVVLGEGDSELVVLPRVLAAKGIAEDDASVAVVPLGGRHVNHFWRLLFELQIPHVTLLDLDSGRFGGGWGRVRNALVQYNKYAPDSFSEAQLKAIPAWDADVEFPCLTHPKWRPDEGPIPGLERKNVFFSHPVDLDLMMLSAYPDAYEAEAGGAPNDSTIVAVLGKKHVHEEKLGDDLLRLFDDYHSKFDLQSKPVTHIRALSKLTDDELLERLPAVFDRLTEKIAAELSGAPE